MNVNKMSLREEYSRSTSAWEVRQDPIFRVWVDDGNACFGFPFFSLVAAFFLKETSTVSLQFPLGAVIVTGPKVQDFFDLFCQNRATCVRSDGVDIVSVTFAKQGLEEDSAPQPDESP